LCTPINYYYIEKLIAFKFKLKSDSKYEVFNFESQRCFPTKKFRERKGGDEEINNQIFEVTINTRE